MGVFERKIYLEKCLNQRRMKKVNLKLGQTKILENNLKKHEKPCNVVE